MSMEIVSRPFQLTTVTPPLIVRQGTTFAAPVVAVFAAKDGAKTFAWSLSVSTETIASDNYRESSRKVDQVKIRNPSDPSQYVTVDRVRQITLVNVKDPSLKRVYDFSGGQGGN